MSMPTAEIEIIMAQLAEMRAEVKHDNERIHDKLDAISRNGCAKAEQHSAAQLDHEARIRGVEQYINRQAGQTALIGGGMGIAATALIGLGKFLLHRIGQ